MNLSVVIPSYNGGEKLAVTVDSILKNSILGLDYIEIIVVDDGSPIPVESFLKSHRIGFPFFLSIIRQSNAGPAAARNAGFRAACGELVIFIDDDILCPSALLQQHLYAHLLYPRTVIFGACPFVRSTYIPPLLSYLDSLDLNYSTKEEKFVQVKNVASGQLSVERSMFNPQQGVYDQNLATPAAEEFELAARLNEQNIPILFAPHITALHNHAVTIENMCRQSYKHGVGCAEVSVKCPATLALPDFQNLIRVNMPAQAGDPFWLIIKKGIKQSFIGVNTRICLLRAIEFIEKMIPTPTLLASLYRMVLGLFLFAGVREGLSKYTNQE